MGASQKNIVSKAPLSIVYHLTDKGAALAEALVPMEEWAQKYIELESENQSNNVANS